MTVRVCPVLIGRADDLRLLERMLDGSSAGGGVAVVAGEPGIGKSRLIREAAAHARHSGSLVALGRVGATRDAPYSALAAALLDVDRRGELPDPIELGAFRELIGLLLPGWRRGPAVGATPELVGEAVLRLLATVARHRGAPSVLVIDDFHWADAGTAAAIDHLARHADAGTVVWLAGRTGEGDEGPAVVDALVRDRVAVPLVLRPLGEAEVVAMASACGATGNLGAVIEAADGVPFLVEELLATRGEVPPLFRDTVAVRLRSLGPEGTRVLVAAALLGRQFDWTLLPGASNAGDDGVRRALAGAVDRQLLVADGAGYAFRHALTRDATLQLSDPAERHWLAGRLLRVVTSGEGLGAQQAPIAARLAVEARRRREAARWYAVSGRQALSTGALAAAETAFRDALSLHHDRGIVLELADVLTRAGRHDEAARVLCDELARAEVCGEGTGAVARLHVELARAAVAGDRFGDAAQHVSRARALGAVEPALTIAEAAVALAHGHAHRVHELAQEAAARAISLREWDVACQALELDGRAARQRGDLQARVSFGRAREIARGAGILVAELRSLHELGTVEMLDRGDVSLLEEARKLAERCGALSTMTVLDLQLAAGYYLIGSLEESLAAAERSTELAQRLQLHVVEAMQWLLAAHVHAARVDEGAAEAALDRARAAAPAVPMIDGLGWAFVRSVLALLRGDVARGRTALDTGIGYLRLDTSRAPAHCYGLWALVRAVEDDDGEAAIAEVEGSGVCINFANRAHLALARAALLGRRGETEMAAQLADEGRAALAPLWRHLASIVLAPAAIGAGWGVPSVWLREADAFFAASGYGEAASACRALLRRSGARVPRGGRSAAGVPPALARLGVTAREVEVLGLVADGLTNQAIAERLFVSPRTVEKHVERLVYKTQVGGRGELIAYANRV